MAKRRRSQSVRRRKSAPKKRATKRTYKRRAVSKEGKPKRKYARKSSIPAPPPMPGTVRPAPPPMPGTLAAKLIAQRRALKSVPPKLPPKKMK